MDAANIDQKSDRLNASYTLYKDNKKHTWLKAVDSKTTEEGEAALGDSITSRLI